MSEKAETAAKKPSKLAWHQFRIWHVLVLMTVVALMIVLGRFIYPVLQWLTYAVAQVLMMLMGATIVSLAVYGKGDARAFCIGAAAAMVFIGPTYSLQLILENLMTYDFQTSIVGLAYLAFLVFGILGGGVVAVWVRRHFGDLDS